MDGAGRSGEAVDIQKWWGSKGGTECSAWIFGQAAERGRAFGAPEPGQLRRRGLCGAGFGSLTGFWRNCALDRIISRVKSIFGCHGWAWWVWLGCRYPKMVGYQGWH